MELRLHRNETNQYELLYGEVVLKSSPVLAELVDSAVTFAKKYRKKLYISQAAVSDWYVGFPQNKDESPEVFYDPFFMVKASQEIEVPYRFVEGPFMSEDQALEAAFRIAGKVGVTKT